MATTKGIEGFMLETHNWGKSVAFWKALGYELEFETDHNSGQLRHPSGGPYIFIAERPAEEELDLAMVPVLNVPDEASFEAPKAGTLEHAFVAQHWGVMEAALRDPDGRRLSVQAPLPAGAEAPAAHGHVHAPSGAR